MFCGLPSLRLAESEATSNAAKPSIELGARPFMSFGRKFWICLWFIGVRDMGNEL